MKRTQMEKLFLPMLAAIFVAMTGCSGSGTGGGSTITSGGGGGATASNTLPITVNTGPTGNYVDGAFTSVTICVPGSTTSCQTIDGILVDTGSSGLRIMASALTLTLPQQKSAGGAPIVECFPFIDGVTWGPVQSADVTMAGEVAKSLPVQVVGSSSFSNIPAGCTSFGTPEDTVGDFGANGVLGVGTFAQDCGEGCAMGGGANPGLYFTCPTANCSVATESTTDQVANPVVFFASDNNGVLVDLPAVTGSETSVSGSLIFGIGTQSDNALGSATVYSIDPDLANFTTVFNGVTYSDAAFVDTGSNAIYFLDSNTTGIPVCTDATFWYCPTTTQNLTATNEAFSNGATGSISFTVANADTITANINNATVAGLAGPDSQTFDWGLPFFFGRKVFVSIEGQNTPAGQGPFVAY